MAEEPEIPVVAQGGLAHLRDLQKVLRERAIPSELVRPPEHLGAPAGFFWLLAPHEHLDAAKQALQDFWGQDLDPETIQAASREVDLDAEQADCPACGTPFTPTAAECPECGLHFG
jgi:uncharacterized protein YfaQ (DUF2300 family)